MYSKLNIENTSSKCYDYLNTLSLYANYRHSRFQGVVPVRQVQDASVGREHEEEVSLVVSLTDSDTPAAVL